MVTVTSIVAGEPLALPSVGARLWGQRRGEAEVHQVAAMQPVFLQAESVQQWRSRRGTTCRPGPCGRVRLDVHVQARPPANEHGPVRPNPEVGTHGDENAKELGP